MVNRSEHYLPAFPDLVRTYNQSVHTSTNAASLAACDSNKIDLWNRMYEPNIGLGAQRVIFKPGDHIRISKARASFEREYTPNWTTEIFHVDSVLDSTHPIVCTLIDLEGERLAGTFYKKEWQKVSEPTSFIIEEVIRSKGKGNRHQHLVKWSGYSLSFNSWVDDKDML